MLDNHYTNTPISLFCIGMLILLASILDAQVEFIWPIGLLLCLAAPLFALGIRWSTGKRRLNRCLYMLESERIPDKCFDSTRLSFL